MSAKAGKLLGWNVYRGGEFVEFMPKDRLPVNPHGVRPLDERYKRILVADLERRHCRERYQVLRRAVEDGTDGGLTVRATRTAETFAELSEATGQRVQSCVDYIRCYVQESVRPDLVGKPVSESTNLCARHAAHEALTLLAERHEDPLLRWLAEYGDWGLSLFSGTDGIDPIALPQGLPADAPDHPGFI